MVVAPVHRRISELGREAYIVGRGARQDIRRNSPNTFVQPVPAGLLESNKWTKLSLRHPLPVYRFLVVPELRREIDKPALCARAVLPVPVRRADAVQWVLEGA